jgi:hypothetical protein
LPALLGVVFLVWIGARLTRSQALLTDEDREVMDGLIVHGLLQSPGRVSIRPSELVFLPAIGEPFSVPLESITSFRESSWFNGSLLVARTGFWLEGTGGKRLGVAVPNRDATRLRKVLSEPATGSAPPK